MSVSELRKHYEKIWRAGVLWEEKKRFTDALTSSHDREHLEFHYSLLEDRTHFYTFCSIRAAFQKHGPPGEAFLVEKFPIEQRPLVKGDALQILGNMQSRSARDFAKSVATDEDEDLRYRAVIVLGWVGTVGDMKTVLRDRVLHDPSAFVRGNAATACRQVWYRIPRAKEPAIEILGEALGPEEDEDAIAGIVVSLQTIMKRRFGLREPDDGPDYVGDPTAAKERALRKIARFTHGA